MFVNVCKSFAFGAGPGSIRHIIIKHVLDCARDELCTVGELLINKCLMCVKFINKHNGLVHLLYAVPVHSLFM